MACIEIKNLTKDYGLGRGIFDMNLKIEKGEVFGFVGTNGAGKTTTIRHLMGFLKPQSGTVTIHGRDCWRDAAEVKKWVGYLPGEIAFPDAATGMDFLRNQAELLGLKDMTYAKQIIERLQLDPTAKLKRMSKGMKQKTAIVAALMATPDILILDEPTTGLDPLMRAEFLRIMEEMKQLGKTIFMSSHMFDEVEQLCDSVALIKDGRIIDVRATQEILRRTDRTCQIEFASQAEYRRFLMESLQAAERDEGRNQVTVTVQQHEINRLLNILKHYDIKRLTQVQYTLESYFNDLYRASAEQRRDRA